MPTPSLDLNCDMGEQWPGRSDELDAAILPYVTSCNIACGFHSGHPAGIERTIRAAVAQGVAIGAHPSYNDREHFGRRSLRVERALLLAELRYQIAALKGMVESFGQRLQHVKPHGALYHDLLTDPALARDFVALVKAMDPGLRIVGLAHGSLEAACAEQGLRYVHEGFADRRYESRDRLRSRRHPDAVLYEPGLILAQVEDFLQGQVRTLAGETCPIRVETLCLHSDTEGAVALSRRIHEYLRERHVHLSAPV